MTWGLRVHYKRIYTLNINQKAFEITMKGKIRVDKNKRKKSKKSSITMIKNHPLFALMMNSIMKDTQRSCSTER
jgi:translation initiation factor 1 (eIF-1/SUI1)